MRSSTTAAAVPTFGRVYLLTRPIIAPAAREECFWRASVSAGHTRGRRRAVSGGRRAAGCEQEIQGEIQRERRRWSSGPGSQERQGRPAVCLLLLWPVWRGASSAPPSRRRDPEETTWLRRGNENVGIVQEEQQQELVRNKSQSRGQAADEIGGAGGAPPALSAATGLRFRLH